MENKGNLVGRIVLGAVLALGGGCASRNVSTPTEIERKAEDTKSRLVEYIKSEYLRTEKAAGREGNWNPDLIRWESAHSYHDARRGGYVFTNLIYEGNLSAFGGGANNYLVPDDTTQSPEGPY